MLKTKKKNKKCEVTYMILREAGIMLIIDQSMSYFCTHNEHY